MKDRSTVPDFPTLQVIDKVLEIKNHPDPTVRQVLAGFSEKERKVAIGFLTRRGDKSTIQIVKDAGYKVTKDSRAAGIVKQISGKMGPLLRAVGITEADLAIVARESLNATTIKIIKRNVYEKDEAGISTGKIIDQELIAMQVPDNPIRLKALDMIMKSGDYFPAIKIDTKKSITANLITDIPEARHNELRKNLEDSKEIEPEFTVESVDEDENAAIN